MQDVKTIGDFDCKLALRMFSGPHAVELKNTKYNMYRGTDKTIQCELFFKMDDIHPTIKFPKKGDTIQVHKIHVELRNDAPKLFTSLGDIEIISDEQSKLPSFAELIKLKHLSF